MFCLCFESPFIFWGRCGVGTVWENMFRVATAVACALYQFIFLHETCLRLLLCCFIFLLFTLVWFVCECVCEPVSGTEQCDQIMRWWGFKPQSVTDQSLYSATSCLVYWNLCVLRYCAMFFLFLNHRANDFSLRMRPILCPWGIDYFSLSIGLTVHFLNWHTLIGMSWKLIGRPSIY